LGLRTTKMKGEVTDAAREKAVLEEVRKKCTGKLLRPEFCETVFTQIMAESKQLQSKKMRLAGFQGEHGAFSEMAMRTFDPSAVPLPFKEFSEVFSAVERGQIDIGIVPVENSLEGPVSQVNDLLVETSLQIIGEINVPVHHCLLAVPDTDYRDIKVVYSHPQALGQCKGFITRNKLDARPFYDTAGAAMMIANDRPKAAAAIASSLCAQLYGLEMLKENIEDHTSNSTRFLVLSGERGKEKGNKCSIIFSTPNKAGALFEALRIFSDAKINLTRIESRPSRGDIGKSAFLLDLQGNDSDAVVAAALAEVKKHSSMYRFLGCYNEAKKIEA
jgi:prephenate dehydratase